MMPRLAIAELGHEDVLGDAEMLAERDLLMGRTLYLGTWRRAAT
jgi:hypothetical protein